MVDFNLCEIENIRMLVENEIERLKNLTANKYLEKEIERYEKIVKKIDNGLDNYLKD